MLDLCYGLLCKQFIWVVSFVSYIAMPVAVLLQWTLPDFDHGSLIYMCVFAVRGASWQTTDPEILTDCLAAHSCKPHCAVSNCLPATWLSWPDMLVYWVMNCSGNFKGVCCAPRQVWLQRRWFKGGRRSGPSAA